MDSLRKGLNHQVETVNKFMYDHVASNDHDLTIDDFYRNQVYLYHQTSARDEANNTDMRWEIVPYNFSKDDGRRRISALSPALEWKDGLTLTYLAEMVHKQEKIIIYVTNIDKKEEPVGIFMFYVDMSKRLCGFIVHSDNDGKMRVSRAIMDIKPNCELPSSTEDLDKKLAGWADQLNCEWEKDIYTKRGYKITLCYWVRLSYQISINTAI